MAITYESYLKIKELISLQQPQSDGPEHDEMLFIIIHQVYELWFKQMLHEVDLLRRAMPANEHPRVCATLRRILTIMKTLVAQIDVLETMTPVSFTSFRSRLASSSGFQSVQFREFEFACGNKREAMIDHHAHDPAAQARLRARFEQPTLFDAFLQYLKVSGYDVPQDALQRDVTRPIGESEAVQDLLVKIYHDDPRTSQVCELVVDFDEGLQEWRYRHVKMVERTIGMKPGTGGSAGAEYLRSTLFRPLFPDLWAIRSRL